MEPAAVAVEQVRLHKPELPVRLVGMAGTVEMAEMVAE
jgi:hypothetical protein